MTAHRPADRIPCLSRTRIALAALAAITMAGCAAQTGSGDDPDSDGDIAVSDAALIRGGGGSIGNSYNCSPDGTCTCDKSIENDCENMTAVCTDATVDGVITCINGWLTTHCTCKAAAIVKPPTPIYTLPIKTAVLKSL